ncbi:LOW QUALITY PROTEIN: hypothetical protein PHMEG_0005648 [Phytophthora megakarya]|uniref:Integrase catalytic domain-containing protein n=1 Tax=Phytophthora megakarya TaxID=4795 RepID=A0A225WSG6_9STRA|nr:LOW QUALITY PROTEIN: hypothetical protein PHMEG_0005648 [Phytophthora megakarya]
MGNGVVATPSLEGNFYSCYAYADDRGVDDVVDLTHDESLGEQDRPRVVTQKEQEEEEEGLDKFDGRSNEDTFGLDSEKFVVEQLRPPRMVAMKAFLESGALAMDSQLRVLIVRMDPQFEMRNGVFMRRVHLRAQAGPANTKLVPVIPLKFIETVLYYCHGALMSVHLGRRRRSKKFDTTRTGLRGKGCRRRMPVKDLPGPFSLVVVDVIGRLTTTDRGNNYSLVFVDYFTRWAEAFAIQALDSITFVNVMIDGVICRHGAPEQLLSDRGTNFTLDLARSLYQPLGIKKLFGSAYHPQTQGLVERFIGSLLGMLRLFVHETQTDWDVYLPRILFAYRTSYHESLGYTPFFSLYGRNPKHTLDLAFLNTTKNRKSDEWANYRRQLYRSLHDSKRMVERQLIKAQDRNALRLQDLKTVLYEEGGSVWVFQHFREKRGERGSRPKCITPTRSENSIGKTRREEDRENAYRIAIPRHPDKVVTVHVNRIKSSKGVEADRTVMEFLWLLQTMNGVSGAPPVEDGDPLSEKDLPAGSYVERAANGSDEIAFTGVSSPILDMRQNNRSIEYLALASTYETCWLSRSVLFPEYDALNTAFENAKMKKKNLPDLRLSERLVDANPVVDEEGLLF